MEVAAIDALRETRRRLDKTKLIRLGRMDLSQRIIAPRSLYNRIELP